MSDMANNWLFACVFVAVIKTFASVNVTHVNIPFNWWQASEKCGSDGLENRESILKENGILQGKTFWIGKAIYNKSSDWLEIMGCYTVPDASKIAELTKITSLGECQINCKLRLPILPKDAPIYFGYNETTDKCMCARNISLVKRDIKDCAMKTSSSAYFIYQVYKGNISAGQGEHCTTLYCIGGQNNLQAANCLTTRAAGRCVNEDTGTPPWEKTFIENLNSCRLKNQLLLPPSTYCKTEKHINQGILSWTNVFRKVYESELTKAEVGNETPLKCIAGQLMDFNGTLSLNTTEMNCSIGLNCFLCRKAETGSSTTPSAVYVPSKSLMTFPKSSGTTSSQARMSYVTHSSTSPGHTKDSKQTKLQKDHSEQGGNPKTIVIGGLLGSCSVIALLAALIVCKVRSIGVFKESSKHDKQENSQMEFLKTVYQDSNITTDKRITTPTSNETYGLTENSTSVYAVVNKIKTPEKINDTYTDAGYGEYDHLHDIQNGRMSPQENLYHSHGAPRNEEDQTYDSSDFGKGKCNDGNSLYDQSSSVVEGEYSYSTNKNHINTNDMGIYDKAS